MLAAFHSASADLGHVGVPGRDKVAGRLVEAAADVLQGGGPQQPVHQVHGVQEGRHRRVQRAEVVGQRLQGQVKAVTVGILNEVQWSGANAISPLGNTCFCFDGSMKEHLLSRRIL